MGSRMLRAGMLRGLCALGVSILVWNAGAGASAGVSHVVEVEGPELIAVLHRVGLTPEALSLSNVSVEACVDLVNRARLHMEEAGWALDSADELCRSREGESLRLERARKSGAAEENSEEALAAAVQRTAEARDIRTQVLDGLFDAAVSGLESEQIGVLRAVRSSLRVNVEPELRVVTRTDEEWVRITEAMAICRAHGGEGAPQDATSLLEAVRADAAVVAARQNLVSLPEVTHAWFAAVNAQ